MAICSYWLRVVAISSGQPSAVSWEAATREASVSPGEQRPNGQRDATPGGLPAVPNPVSYVTI